MDRQIIIFIMYDTMAVVAVSPSQPHSFFSSQTDFHPEWNHGSWNVESQFTREEAKYFRGTGGRQT